MDNNQKVIIEFIGGIGNQLFQYAFLYSLQKRNPGKKFFAHTGRFKLITDNLGFQLKDFFELEINEKDYNWANKLDSQNFIDKVYRKLLQFKGEIIIENDLLYNERYLFINNRDCIYYRGLWQNEKYFIDYKTELLQSLKFRINLTLDIFNLKNDVSISMHVRRGDYISNSRYEKILGNVCDEKYYQTALKIMDDKINYYNLIIFSDDIAWVKENYDFVNRHNRHVVFSNKTAEEELQLMSLCDHNIIANSTFSWWGAWLNKNNSKIVVAPKTWFKDITKKTDIVPNYWIGI